MPEIYFRVRWPDATQTSYYSPSFIIKEFFDLNETLSISEFLRRANEALQIASDRVAQKYGFPCSRAHTSLAAINDKAMTFSAQDHAVVTVLEFLT